MRIATPKKLIIFTSTIRATKRWAVFVIFFVFSVLFLLPAKIHAMEAVYAVLKDSSGLGGQVQAIWKSLLNVVNSVVVLVLIFVAFAEMLRINVNTYGIKKILPTLILAIIAANFSYMFCRLIVDVANVSLTFINSISGNFGPHIAEPNPFNWDAAQTWYQQFFSNVVLQNLALLIEAIILLCLAFLFIVRNWVVYALVIFSPIAFMAMVLPQTKKYFTQWWSMLIQWTFMPLISFIFIALASRFSGSFQSVSSFPIMAPVFVIVCYYYAITMPFKLGGTVMQSFYKGTGAKHLTGKAKELGVTKAQGLGLRAWNSYQQAGLDAQRGENALGRLKIGNWKVGEAIGRNWAGNALIKAKANLEHEDARSKGLVEGIKARHYYGQGDKLVLERAYNRNREGEIKEYGLYMTEDLIRQGLEDEKAGRTNSRSAKNLGILRNWRAGSAVAKIRMSTAEEAENSLINKGIRQFMRDPASESISAETKADLLKAFGYSNKEYDRFRSYYQFVTSDRDSTEAEAKKAMGDPTRDAMEEIIGTHNVAEFQSYSQKIAGLVNQWGTGFKTFCTGTEAQIATMVSGMSEENRALWNRVETQTALKQGKGDLAFLRKIAIDQRALNRREVDQILDTDTAGTEIRERMVTFANKNYQSKIAQIQEMIKKNDGVVPLHLADLVSRDGDGGLGLKHLDGLRASRMRLLMDKRIQDGATEWMTQYGLSALGEALINGLPYESTDPGDIVAVHYNRVQSGRSRKNARKGQQIELGVIKGMTLGNQTQALESADHFYNFLRHYQQHPEAIPEAIRAEIISDQKREREEIHARLRDEFSTEELRHNLVTRGGEPGTKLAAMVERDSLTDDDHQQLYQLLQDTFKSASLQGTGGTSLGRMIVKSTFGERARVAEGSS